MSIKKILAVLLLLVAICGSNLLFSCGRNCEIVHFQTAYEKGIIDIDDIKLLAYRTGKQTNVGVFEDDYLPEDLGVLSDDLKKQIEKAVGRGNYIFSCGEKDVTVTGYYGVYKGYYAVSYEVEGAENPAVVEEVFIGDYKFLYNAGDAIYLIKI